MSCIHVTLLTGASCQREGTIASASARKGVHHGKQDAEHHPDNREGRKDPEQHRVRLLPRRRIFCLVGIACIGIPGSFKVGGITIHSVIDNLQGLSLETCYTAMAMGLIICTATCIEAKMSECYFKHELAAGTPFTIEGAKELLRLGICTICIPLGAIIVAQAYNAIASHFLAGVAEINIEGGAPVVLGIAFIIMSLICKYGAELKGNTGNQTTTA